jgi:hypothetical protein
MIQITIESASPREAALELLAFVDTVAEQVRGPAPAKAQPTPAENKAGKADKADKTDEANDDAERVAARRAAKAAEQAARKAAQAAEQAARDAEEAAAGAPEERPDDLPPLTIEDVRARLNAVMGAMGIDQAKSYLRGVLGVSKVSDLPQERYLSVIRTLDQKLAILAEQE